MLILRVGAEIMCTSFSSLSPRLLGKFFFVAPPIPLVEEHLIIIYLSRLKTIFYAFSGLDQVSEGRASMTDEPVIGNRGQSTHE